MSTREAVPRAASRNGAQLAGCANCASCEHWAQARDVLEARIGGLASFGSAYGASVGESRLCVRLDRLTMPEDRCGAFAAREA
jgi:hypothetical protein